MLLMLVADAGCGLRVGGVARMPDPGGTARLTAGAPAHDIFALCSLLSLVLCNLAHVLRTAFVTDTMGCKCVS